jgi:MFS family permease
MVSDPFRRAQVAIGALFCFLGFQYGTWVSRVPSLQQHLGLDDAQLGLLLLAPGVGAVVSFPLVTILMRRYGSRLLAIGSGLALVAVLAGLAFASHPVAAALILLGDGVLIGCLNVAMNAQGAALEERHSRTTMARLHAVFSAGILAAALLASGVTAVSHGLAVHFGAAAAILLLLLAVARGGTLREDPAAPAPADRARRRWAVPSAVLVGLGVAMVLAELAEGAMNDWSALYLQDIAGAGPGVTPLGVAVISGVMLVARLFADGWRQRWGDRRVVLAGGMLAGAGLGAALLAGGVVPALAGFACVGLGMAATTPCVYVAAARLGPAALSLVAAMGTAGLLTGPPLIGFVAHSSNLRWGMAVVVAATMLLTLCAATIRWPAADPATADPTTADPTTADPAHR